MIAKLNEIFAPAAKVVATINTYLTDYVLLFLLIGIGLFYTVRTKFVQVRCFGEGMKKVFGGIKLARDLFDGNVNAVACIGEGSIQMGGNISMIDNVNRILDRVALYLA